MSSGVSEGEGAAAWPLLLLGVSAADADEEGCAHVPEARLRVHAVCGVPL